MEETAVVTKMHLSTKILFVLVGVLLLTGTGVGVWALASQTYQPTLSVAIEETTLITAIEARDIAVNSVGSGVVSELSFDGTAETYTVTVQGENESFEIILDATDGRVVNMVTTFVDVATEVDEEPPTSELEEITTTHQSNVAGNGSNGSNGSSASNNSNNSSPSQNNASPTSSANTAGNLTSDQAIELARTHLVSIGINNPTFRYSYSDRENGVAVWSIEFRYGGRDLEFYVVKATGEFLKAPRATNNSANASSNQSQSSTNNQTNGSISREEAGEIALAFSGGRLVEVSRDSWRGRPAWWAETRANRMVHEFYICMETGEILEHESERDD